MKKLFALMLMILPVFALADAPQDPQAVVQSAVTSLTARLKAEKPHLKDNPKLLYSIIDENITPYVDINGIAKRVMGQYYRQATDQQHAQFIATFKDSMVRTYANGLASYNNQKITFLPFKQGDDQAIAQVDVQVTGDSGTVYPVTFQMKKDAQGNWKTQNLIVNGINLGLTFRNQFAAAVDANKGDIGKAIAGWAPDTQVAKAKSE
jgi:phospholipid transport system substrate-binding protein